MIQAIPLINTQFASASQTTEYTAPAATRTIVDKFTATNIDTGAQTITVNIVPAGQSVGAQNTITKAFSIAAGATAILSEMQNQILASGDFISVIAGTGAKVVIRASGREIT
jgi:hypothetical protein